MADDSLLATVLNRIDSDQGLSAQAGLLVYAAIVGDDALAEALESPTPLPARTDRESGVPAEPVGAYLAGITVAGFRGIGEERSVALQPGPGLTLILGRNGSGKSSFAEAAELALTGASVRWSDRASIWRQGFRNLHVTPPKIKVELHVEGVAGRTRVDVSWPDSAQVGDALISAQRPGQPKGELASLGWQAAMSAYRPFLSYEELGALLTSKPTELYDALAAILGLEDLASAEKRLGDYAREARERQQEIKADKRDSSASCGSFGSLIVAERAGV